MMSSISTTLRCLALCSVLCTTQAHAQTSADPLFPGSGRWAVSLASGLPFVAMSEAAVGVGDRATLGMIAGITPRVWGVGVRPRIVLLRDTTQRLSLIVPTIYYPREGARHAQPWVLTRPGLRFDQRIDEVTSIHLGTALMTVLRLTSPPSQDAARATSALAGLWASFQVGITQRWNRRWSTFADVDLVYDLHGIAWPAVGGTRVVISLGVAWLP